jgi:hypothetical protein
VVPQDHLYCHKWSPRTSCVRHEWSPVAISGPPYWSTTCILDSKVNHCTHW